MQAIELSEDEARYLVLDRLLHPELNFAPQTSDKDADDDARALELLEEAHTSAGMDSTVGLNQGDEYVHQRKLYVSRRFMKVPSLPYDSWPSHFHESGFFFEFEAIRAGTSRAPRTSSYISRRSGSPTASTAKHTLEKRY